MDGCVTHQVTEDYMIRLYIDANLASIHGSRCLLFPKDLQLTQRMRGEA